MAEDSDRFVTIRSLGDATLAHMTADVLEQAGIPVLLPGVEHRGMLGMLGAYVAIPVRVPASRAEEALAILDALDDAEAEIEPGEEVASTHEIAPHGEDLGEAPYRHGEATAPLERPRLRRVAAFCAIGLTFGTAHMYVGRYREGLALLATEGLTLFALNAGAPFLVLMLPAVVALDLFGAFRIIARQQAGYPKPTAVDRVAQAGPFLLPFLLFALAFPIAARTLDPVTSVRAEAKALCAAWTACGGGSASICHEELERALAAREVSPHSVYRCARCLDGQTTCESYEACETDCARR